MTLGKNRMTQPFPGGWEVGSVHTDTFPGYWTPIKFEIVGWYINHVHDKDVHRFIKNGKAYAVKFLTTNVKTVESTLPSLPGGKARKNHKATLEKGGPRAFKQMSSEVYGW